MRYLLAALPILIILGLMISLRWGGQRAAPVGWLAGVLVAAGFFGLTPQVFWVSQAKGFLLSMYVLIVMWPALMLYYTVNEAGGIHGIARGLEKFIGDRGLMLVTMAWLFSGLLEAMAGFGLPIAVASPMLVLLGVPPVTAIAAIAVGHSWAVTFGSMGVVFQTLTGISLIDPQQLAGPSAVLLGLDCLFCGLGAALILGERRHWKRVLVLAAVVASVQYLVAVSGLPQLAVIAAGMAGILGARVLGRNAGLGGERKPGGFSPELKAGMTSYVGLMLLFVITALPGPLHTAADSIAWAAEFPQVATRTGFTTAAGNGPVFKPLLHPVGMLMVAAGLSALAYWRLKWLKAESFQSAVRATVKASIPASIGVIAAVGVSTLMDHSGMTMLLAQGLSQSLQRIYPLVSPWVGMLGAFATGSNNNSNVLFASLQKNTAILLGLNPVWLVAAQTAGGALGSMIAPAKIIVGCSTTGVKGKDADVLRITLPIGISIGLLIGFMTLLITLVLKL